MRKIERMVFIMKVRGFLGLRGRLSTSKLGSERGTASFSFGNKGEIRFLVERDDDLVEISLSQSNLKESVEQWLNRVESQSDVESLVMSIYE